MSKIFKPGYYLDCFGDLALVYPNGKIAVYLSYVDLWETRYVTQNSSLLEEFIGKL